MTSVAWPRFAPDRIHGGMAASLERKGAKDGRYPPEWPGVAWIIKTQAGWSCERCAHPHDPSTGYCLTVHHLDGVKWNLESWNLAALCQRCHLSVQARVQWYRLWPWPHTPWMVPHIEQFNEWAPRHGEAPMPLEVAS